MKKLLLVLALVLLAGCKDDKTPEPSDQASVLEISEDDILENDIKKNSLIRRKKRTEHSNIDVETLSRFEIDAFEVNENIFEDIWNAYYKENK